jgi:pyruvate formate lyase activating enzyme
MNGLIFDIKRFAVHDGPGIRTTVFMKGCPLSCPWCHNPESISQEICTVIKTVRLGTKTFKEEEIVGREMTVEDILFVLRKEQIFMEESGGGVTFSGGEPLMQPYFLKEILEACQYEGFHTTVDTSGFAKWKVLKEVALYTDLFLYDLKLMNSGLHKTVTGVPNLLILKNLTRLLDTGKKVRIRLPMIPGITYTENNISSTIEFLNSLTHPVDGVDLLPFHNTALHKYIRFGIENQLKDLKPVNKNELLFIKQQFEEAGFVVQIGG